MTQWEVIRESALEEGIEIGFQAGIEDGFIRAIQFANKSKTTVGIIGAIGGAALATAVILTLLQIRKRKTDLTQMEDSVTENPPQVVCVS